MSLAPEASVGRGPHQPVVTRRTDKVRVLVTVLVGLVVVLMVLTELCLWQSAALRRRIQAALPPDEEEER
jgi:hypothetical protein